MRRKRGQDRAPSPSIRYESRSVSPEGRRAHGPSCVMHPRRRRVRDSCAHCSTSRGPARAGGPAVRCTEEIICDCASSDWLSGCRDSITCGCEAVGVARIAVARRPDSILDALVSYPGRRVHSAGAPARVPCTPVRVSCPPSCPGHARDARSCGPVRMTGRRSRIMCLPVRVQCPFIRLSGRRDPTR